MRKNDKEFLKNRCKTCLMPDFAVKMKGDKCNYCLPDEGQKRMTLADIVDSDTKGITLDSLKELTRQATGKYDCLVGMTGGRDSTYLLYYAKEVMGLKPLAANFDTGFMTDEMVANMQKCVSVLGVDFIRFKADWRFFQKLLRGFFINYGEFCSACHQGHHYTLAKFAKDNNIRVILRGISSKTDLNQVDPHFFDFFCKTEEEFNEKIHGFAKDVGITDEELEFHKDFLHLESWADKEVKTIDLPDLLEYNGDQIQDILTNKFNWQHPPAQFLHGDCILNPVSIYLSRNKHGYSEKQIIVSNLLAHGDIGLDRGKELLLTEENIGAADIPQFDKVLEILDIDRTAFEKVVDTHWKKE